MWIGMMMRFWRAPLAPPAGACWGGEISSARGRGGWCRAFSTRGSTGWCTVQAPLIRSHSSLSLAGDTPSIIGNMNRYGLVVRLCHQFCYCSWGGLVRSMTDAHWTTHYWTFSEPLPVYISKLLPLSLALRFFDFQASATSPACVTRQGRAAGAAPLHACCWLLKYRGLLAS